MIKKIICISFISIIILLSSFNLISQAKTKIGIESNKNSVELNEEFVISIDGNNTNIAAFTIWIYYDNEKVECLTDSDNINIINNRIIYTWFSNTGYEQELDKLLELNFKAISTGIANFTVLGEFYNEKGEEIELEYNQMEVKIEDKNSDGSINESGKKTDSNSVNLDILRLNKEGIIPDFNKEITQYYLIVDENTENIEITAIPESNKANVKIQGNNNLKNGINEIKIIVSNNNKEKEYNINVTKTNEQDKANTILEILAIEYYDIYPEYSNNITNYEIQISNSEENINILAIPEDMDASVEIKGNTDLKEGSNTVEVLVTARNGITKKTYIIEVYKRNEKEEKIYQEEQAKIQEEAEIVLEKMNNEYIDRQDEDVTEANNENEEKNAQNTVLSIIGIVLSIITIGAVVIRIRKEHKTKE